jgi:hypothetical protein
MTTWFRVLWVSLLVGGGLPLAALGQRDGWSGGNATGVATAGGGAEPNQGAPKLILNLNVASVQMPVTGDMDANLGRICATLTSAKPRMTTI